MDTHFKDALNISNMRLPCTGCTSTVVDEKSTKLAQDMCQMYKINREKAKNHHVYHQISNLKS